VLRLYPVVPGNQREALNDDIWPDGTYIKKGDNIGYHSFCQARLEKLWGVDAKEFKPERWILEDGTLKEEEPGKWTVFHIGPRICLGK
jgi:cytochrome P450